MSRYYPPVTVTGNPVNFSAPNGGKLDSVSVQIIPTQDLHGYANPWPGGGGKNVMPNVGNSTTFQNVTLTYNSGDSTYTLNGSTTSAGNIPLASISPTLMNWVVGNGYTLSCRVVSGSFTLGEGTGITYAVAIFDSSNSSFIRGGTRPTEADLDGYTCTGNAFSSAGNYQLMLQCWRVGTVFDNLKIRIQIEAGSSATSWTPYSNICPISGLTGLSVYVSPTQDPDDATVYNVDWTTQAGTVYHGTVDVVSGELTVDMVNIPSYNGETITEPWLSSMDAYAAGTTPTIGAQVVYTLADPAVYQLGHKFLTVLSGENYVWASNNETISVVYALLVPGSDKYTLIVNGVDIADFVERDSYRTTLYPVFSEAVQTLDGVGHTALLRKKGELSARFNPRTAADTAIICAALLNAPCEVQYHCLQRNADVTALMTIDSVSALYLSRCLYCRQKWNDIDSITLTEL